MNRIHQSLVAAIAGGCCLASSANAQVPALVDGSFETPDPYLREFFPNPGPQQWAAQGWRSYNYASYRWVGDGFTPQAQTHGGLYSYIIPGGLGRANGEFEGIETEGSLDLSNSTSLFDWPAYNFDPSTSGGPTFTLSCWFMIPADDPMVGTWFGMKLGFHRSGSNLVSHYWDYEWHDVDPAVSPAPSFPDDHGIMVPLTIVSTPNGPGVHTGGKWLHITHVWNQSQFCVCSVPTNATSCTTAPSDPGCSIFPSPPTNPAYVSMLALRFSTIPSPNQANTFGTVWVDDVGFTAGTTGSCCMAADGSCAASTSAACSAPNTFLPGGACTAVTCPDIGVCCTGSTCTSPVFQSACVNFGNLWTSYANGGACSPNPCRVACCDGSGGCSFVLADSCAGTIAIASTCTGGPCTVGACCDITSGACTQVMQSACLTSTTRFQASIACSSNTCAPAGACCAADNTCARYEQQYCAGTYRGDNTTCAPNPCVTSGVCCRGATCTTTVPQANCTGTSQHFTTSGATCNAANNGTTPCCYADYDKVGGITVGDIFAFLNDWFAGSFYTNVGTNGTAGPLAVQNIFDFLNYWFAGC
jgi:hypothetical protein